MVWIQTWMKRTTRLQAVSLCCLGFAHAAAEDFPRPPELQANIAFWTKVYGEWTTNQIAITDTEDLSMIYTVVDVPSPGMRQNGLTRDQIISRSKDAVKVALYELEHGQVHSDLAREIAFRLKDNNRPDKYICIDGIRAQNGLRDRFEAGYRLSGAHDKEIRARLRRHGLPEELIALVFVESLFYQSSMSHVGAAGLWQFMRGTAKEYMRINPLVDERYDPVIATDAAIEYLKRAKERLYAWPIAITSYNYGRAGMQRAVEQVGSYDLVDVLKGYHTSRFGFAARNYYAEFIAALDVYQNASQYFPDINPVQHWAYDVVELSSPIFANDIAGFDADWFRQYNPALTQAARSGKEVIPSGYTIRIPESEKERVNKRIASISPRERERAASQLRARHRANGRQRLLDIVKAYDIFYEQLAKRLGYALNEKPKKGSIILVRSADSRFTEVPKPIYDQ